MKHCDRRCSRRPRTFCKIICVVLTLVLLGCIYHMVEEEEMVHVSSPQR